MNKIRRVDQLPVGFLGDERTKPDGCWQCYLKMKGRMQTAAGVLEGERIGSSGRW